MGGWGGPRALWSWVGDCRALPQPPMRAAGGQVTDPDGTSGVKIFDFTRTCLRGLSEVFQRM